MYIFQWYPEKPKPSTKAVKQIIGNFKNTGSVKRKAIKTKPILNNTNVGIAILGYLIANPTSSIMFPQNQAYPKAQFRGS